MSDRETDKKPDDRFEPFYRPLRWSRSNKARYLSLWMAWFAGWSAFIVAAKFLIPEPWRAAIMTAVLLHVIFLALDAVRYKRWKRTHEREGSTPGFESP